MDKHVVYRAIRYYIDEFLPAHNMPHRIEQQEAFIFKRIGLRNLAEEVHFSDEDPSIVIYNWIGRMELLETKAHEDKKEMFYQQLLAGIEITRILEEGGFM